MTDDATVDADGFGPDLAPVPPWAEAELVSVIADMAAASARYHVVVTLTFVPPDPEPDL